MISQQNPTERVIIIGEFEVSAFMPWIERYVAKLGLTRTIITAVDTRIELELSGESDLVDMLEVGCLLGPIEVWVETIIRQPQSAA